jgi:hypothetical protein
VFAMLRPAAIQKGSRGLTLPARLPSAGPTMKPNPKAALMRPKPAARRSGGVTSPM